MTADLRRTGIHPYLAPLTRPGTRGVTAIDFRRILAITSHFNLKLTDFILMIRHARGDGPSSQKFSCFSQREGERKRAKDRSGQFFKALRTAASATRGEETIQDQ